jgi:8-oxo-dGTP pyrophosphatase MutT (NUDIX family)
VPIASRNIFENVRTRVIVLHAGRMLLLEPDKPEAGWRVPGGGLEPDESLFECAEREVREETGILVKATGIAFLREFVVPRYCTWIDEAQASSFRLEVYIYAAPLDEAIEPRRERPGARMPRWVPLAQVPDLPLWPKEMRALAAYMLAGHAPQGVPSFVSQLESPFIPAPRGIEFP